MAKSNPVTKAPRFFGGHYDSVKQAAVKSYLLEHPTPGSSFTPIAETQENLKWLYTARLRLDILLAGDVIITDAQYYDGSFFHCLGDPGNDFLRAIDPATLQRRHIEVGLRPHGLVEMINKPFTFSALSTDEVKEEVRATMAGVLSKHGRFRTARAALNAYVKAVDKTVRPEMQSLSDRLMALWKDTPRELYVASLGGEKRESSRQHALRDLPYKMAYGENESADAVLRVIQEEMEAGSWNRTRMWKEVNRFRNEKTTKTDTTRDDPVEQAWAWFLKVYNRALAYQLDCNCIDVGEEMVYSYTNTKADDEYRERVLKPLEGDVLEGLALSLGEEIAKESWLEFFKRIDKEPLRSAVAKWRIAKISSMSMSRIAQSTSLLHTLNNLVTEIRRSYGRIATWNGFVAPLIGTGLAAGIVIVAGGALTDVISAPGIVLGGIAIPIAPAALAAAKVAPLLVGLAGTAKKMFGRPLEQYNLIEIGMKHTER